MLKAEKHINVFSIKTKEMWGYSSVGRAPALQAGGHEFESHYLHQKVKTFKVLYLENHITVKQQ
jgi:hypothetical protein